MNISGIWKFRKDADGSGESQKWFDGLRESEARPLSTICVGKGMIDLKNAICAC